MATLSICMIVKNEATNLPRSLASVKSVSDEIIVVDTGSTDKTVAIAQKAGANVSKHPWKDDFAAARNVSLQQATQDWILILDADETLTPAGQQLIQSIKQDKPLGQIKPEDLLLVTLLRREIGANQSPYTQVSRLFRNLPKIEFIRPYHESIDESVEVLMAAEEQWQIAQFGDVAIDHTGYGIDEIAAKDKLNRARKIMAAHLAEHPQDAYMANKLGALYTQSNEWDRALSTLQTALSSGNFDPMTQYELHYHLGIAHRNLIPVAGQMAAAEENYRKAIALPINEKLKLGAHLNLGALLKLKKDLAGALEQYEIAARIDPSQPMTYLNIGLVHRARGYLEPALRAYEYVITLAPGYGAAYQNLAVVLFKLGRLPESKQAFEKAIRLIAKTNPAESDRIRQGMKALGLDKIS
ncbi:MAG: glycosyltransferase [Cyanobacteria bacterium J06634_5]